MCGKGWYSKSKCFFVHLFSIHQICRLRLSLNHSLLLILLLKFCARTCIKGHYQMQIALRYYTIVVQKANDRFCYFIKASSFVVPCYFLWTKWETKVLCMLLCTQLLASKYVILTSQLPLTLLDILILRKTYTREDTGILH